jgi:hypothetical protein
MGDLRSQIEAWSRSGLTRNLFSGVTPLCETLEQAAAAIAERDALRADLKATLRREDDANRAAFDHLRKTQSQAQSLSDALALIRRAQSLIVSANFPWHEDADELLKHMEAQNGQCD